MIGPNPLLERLAAGEAVGAFWLALGSVAAAEVMAETRPHAMIFDMQHGLWDRKSLFEAFAAIRGRSLAGDRIGVPGKCRHFRTIGCRGRSTADALRSSERYSI